MFKCYNTLTSTLGNECPSCNETVVQCEGIVSLAMPCFITVYSLFMLVIIPKQEKSILKNEKKNKGFLFELACVSYN